LTVSFIANRKRAALAALASLVTVLALTAYVSAPSWPDPSLAAEYASASGRTLVTVWSRLALAGRSETPG
jgi:hypothetical protein